PLAKASAFYLLFFFFQKTEVIEEAFPGMFMDTPEDEKTKLISCLGAFRQFWASLSQVSAAVQMCSSIYPKCLATSPHQLVLGVHFMVSVCAPQFLAARCLTSCCTSLEVLYLYTPQISGFSLTVCHLGGLSQLCHLSIL
uniref:Uncharacterized protein n=1 Tax=Ornithorhynchus anatinus TaxID=9258 RepID=A0A6I8NQI0_ORNAN